MAASSSKGAGTTARRGAAPLTVAEREALFRPLAGAALIALAVSGGADSLALLDSIDRWRQRRRNRPEVLILTVDHRLRRGSSREAASVAELARARGLAARVLVRRGPLPAGDVEGEARAARYRLLIGAAREAGASHLVVAHHSDDLAEGFLLRLKRGAGVFGLAAMRPTIALGDLSIVRPLLAVPRARLLATVAAAGLTAVVDPMNADSRFDRARLRQLMPILAGEGLDAAHLAATALRLADLADAVDEAASAVIAVAVAVDELAVAWLDPERLAVARGEVRGRVLTRLLLAVGGADYPPRFSRQAALLAAMLDWDGRSRFKRTLAGTVIEGRGGRFALYRETGRGGLASIRLKAGPPLIYDHRFRVTIGRGLPPGLTLGPLGETGRSEAGLKATAGPIGALDALPAIRRKGRLVAIPSLSWARATVPVAIGQIVAERLAEPPLFPDLASGR